MRKELLLGCGRSWEKVVGFEAVPPVFTNLTTLDINPAHKPDVVHDLSVLPYPFADEEFDEVHAYEVLEHTGQQGDWRFFFAQFAELWRIIKPDGYLMGSCPNWDSEWAWADPGHTRILTPRTLWFLDQKFYEEEIGKTAASDYRDVWKHSFVPIGHQEKGDQWFFILQKK